MIHIVPSFHYDVAYLKSYDEYLPECFRNIDEALRLMQVHPEYCYLLEQVLLLDEYWQRFPEKRELLKRFAKEGRLDVAPGMWVMPDMNHCDGESLFIQCQLGKRWLREHLDVDPKVCWIADCWGHHAQLPQVLRACGYEYYVFWRCMRRDVRRNDFIWQGIDGTQLPTHWLARGYSNVRFPSTGDIHNVLELNLTGCDVPDVQRLINTLEQYDGRSDAIDGVTQPSNDNLLICNGGDMTFPQASASGVLNRLNESGELPELQFSTPSRFLSSIRWESKPVIRGEFNSAFQGTFTQNIRIKQLNRELCSRMFTLERLSVVLDRRIDPATVDTVWKLLLKQQFHDIICGSITDRALDDCYREFQEAAGALDGAFKKLCGGSDQCYFNPLPWRRLARTADGLVDLPALGFAAATEAPTVSEAMRSLPCEFVTPFYSAKISAIGYVGSLIEAKSGRELVRANGDSFGGLGLQVDDGDPWLNFEGPISGGSLESSLTQNTPDPWDRSVPDEIVNRATFRAAKLEASIVHHSNDELVIRQRGVLEFWRIRVEFETIIRLSSHSPRIEYETTLHPTGKHYRIRVGFPCSIENPKVRNDIPFGIETREAGEHVAQYWAGLDDGHVGLALINAGTPSSNGCDGVLMLTLFRSAAMEYKTSSEKSFLNGVTHTFRYALVPHAADEARVVREAAEFNFPPVACDSTAATALSEWAFPEAMQLSALRQEADGVLVRVYDGLGNGIQGTIGVPKRFTRVTPVDGIGRPTGESMAVSGKLDVKLAAFEIKTFRLSD